jgi:hypothetical protein
MNPIENAKTKCDGCLEKNVHVLMRMDTDGQKACPSALKGSLRMASSQNVQVLRRFLSMCLAKCPSAPFNLDGYIMDDNVKLLWLPADRVAMLMNRSIKTVRRMILEHKYPSVKRGVSIQGNRTQKLFMLCDQELIDLENEHCRKLNLKPVYKEYIDLPFNQDGVTSIFITSYEPRSTGGKHES